MSICKEKYINALLYFIEHCNNKFLGKTKLNKLFYYLDFIYYRDNSKSITGDKYRCLDYGPVPRKIDDIIAEAKKKKLIKIEQLCSETKKKEFSLLSKVNKGIFNEKEKELLSKICTEFADYSTQKIVDQTHFEAPWFYADLYDDIDYDYANDIDFFRN